ncbi:MAG: hypothetical protein KKD17_04760 [Nanoarchaeota archaeon]|nr:hypothetical protein [Nanoarchaeota archaeon]
MYEIKPRNHKQQAAISSPGGTPKYLELFAERKLIQEYVLKQKSISHLAKEFNVDSGTIRRYFRTNRIRTRTTKEQVYIDYPPKKFEVTPEALAFIDGLLLGDASIPLRKNGVKPRVLSQACKYRDYLEYILKRLYSLGVECSPILSFWSADKRCKHKGYVQNFLQTHRYETFELFRERWYKTGKKRIPRDLQITPDFLLQCYLGDGNFYREILLCLNDFPLEDLLFLKALIEREVSIRPRIRNSSYGYMLSIKKSECAKFIEYLGACPVQCYAYKWQDNESEEAKERKRIKAKIAYHRRNGKVSNICGSVSRIEKTTL